MVPKPLQNRSWRGSGGHLGATLETRCFQDFIFDDFGSILGPPLGPVWAHFGHHLLMFFWSGFLMALVSIWAPKTHPKWNPKGTQHENIKNIYFVAIYYTWATSRRPENHHFGHFLGPFLDTISRPLFDRFWTLFGDPSGSPGVHKACKKKHQNNV